MPERLPPVFAVLNVYKPLEMTSHDVVQRLRRCLGIRRIGHLGTLDPMAEGVLPVCIGQATRLIEYFPTDKRYRAEITLGLDTSSHDREGEIVSQSDASHLTQADIEAVLPAFTGTFDQKVPLHSAVHVKGKKLYTYAHKGQTPEEIPTRPVTIHALSLVECLGADEDGKVRFVLDIHCAGGTYVRALARDIGQRLGVGGMLSALTRTAHGRFELSTATPLDTLLENPNPHHFFLDPVEVVGLPEVWIEDETRYQELLNGMKIPIEPSYGRLGGNELYLALYGRMLIGVVQVSHRRLQPIKILNVPRDFAAAIN
jgi:tRNA pseudouridine55 synthase